MNRSAVTKPTGTAAASAVRRPGTGPDPVEQRSGAQSPTQRPCSTGQVRLTRAPGGTCVPRGTLATSRWPLGRATCIRSAEPA